MLASITNHRVFKQCFISSIAILLHWNWGICQGFSAMLIPQLQEAQSELSISEDQLSWIASLFPLSMPVGSLIVGVFMEMFGRKTALQFAFLLLITGWTIIFSANTVIMLYIGRVLTGIASGMDPVVIVYIVETNTPTCRSIMMALTGPITIFGSLLAYVFEDLLPWKEATLIYIAVAVVSFVMVFYIPESPAWLVARGDTAGALKSLKRLRSAKDEASTEVELTDLQSALKTSSSEDENVSYFSKIMETKAWKPFIILEVVFILQQASGYNVQTYYSTLMYEHFDTPIDESVSSIGYMSTCLLASILFLAIVKRVDRTTLCFWSGLGVCLSYLSITAYLYLLQGVQNKPMLWFPVIASWISVASGSIGLYSLPWQMPAELFPTQVRGFMSGFLLTSVYFWTFVCVKLYPTAVSLITIQGVLMIFAVAAGAAAVFCKFVVPETRGKTLKEIEQFW